MARQRSVFSPDIISYKMLMNLGNSFNFHSVADLGIWFADSQLLLVQLAYIFRPLLVQLRVPLITERAYSGHMAEISFGLHVRPFRR